MRKLLFFHANWCSPCKYFRKIYIKPIEDELPKQVELINAQDEPKLADEYDITRLPSYVPIDENGKGWPMHCHFDSDTMIRWLKGEGPEDFWRKTGWRDGLDRSRDTA